MGGMNMEEIVPGKTYPKYVSIKEKDGMHIELRLNSFFVGMYCEIQINGKLAGQVGDHNNKKFVTGLKKDITKAMERGATVEIGSIAPVKLFP